MCKIILIALVFLLPLASNSQGKRQLTFLSRWDNDSLKHIGNQTFNDVWGWAAADGREYAIIGAVDSIYFIEVSNPRHPVIRDAKAGKYNNCIHRDMQTSGHYAYCVADEGTSSLQIFDLQYLPDSVHKVYDSDTLIERAHNVFIEGKWLYIAYPKTRVSDSSNRIVTPHALMIASIDNPEKPMHVQTIESDVEGFEFVHDLYVRHDTAYMSCGYDGMRIWDFTDHTTHKSVASLAASGFNHSSALSKDGKTLIFTYENNGAPINRYSLGNLHKPSISDRKPDWVSNFGLHTDLGSVAHNPFIKDNYLYTSYYHDGVAVFDLNDSNRLVDYYDTYPQNGNNYAGFQGCWGVYPFLPSGTIIASDMTNGLFCLRFDTITGIEDFNNTESNISVFPNPVHDNFNLRFITSQTEKATIELYSITGARLWSVLAVFSPSEKIKNFNLPEFISNGVYILKIHAVGRVINYRIIRE